MLSFCFIPPSSWREILGIAPVPSGHRGSSGPAWSGTGTEQVLGEEVLAVDVAMAFSSARQPAGVLSVPWCSGFSSPPPPPPGYFPELVSHHFFNGPAWKTGRREALETGPGRRLILVASVSVP